MSSQHLRRICHQHLVQRHSASRVNARGRVESFALAAFAGAQVFQTFLSESAATALLQTSSTERGLKWEGGRRGGPTASSVRIAVVCRHGGPDV